MDAVCVFITGDSLKNPTDLKECPKDFKKSKWKMLFILHYFSIYVSSIYLLWFCFIGKIQKSIDSDMCALMAQALD